MAGLRIRVGSLVTEVTSPMGRILRKTKPRRLAFGLAPRFDWLHPRGTAQSTSVPPDDDAQISFPSYPAGG